VTFTGLNRWYVEKFEKLGWMILAKAHGYNDKILCYKTSLARLKEAIEHKLSHTSDADHKADLKIMWNNVNILIDHVNKDFGI
jgi:predicted ATP-binding protein involved in virulence